MMRTIPCFFRADPAQRRYAPEQEDSPMQSLVFASIAVVLAFQGPPAPRPDFSGTWTMDRSRSQTAESVTLDIKHTATEISIETNQAGKISKRTYPLEPTPHPAAEAITAGHS